MRDLFVQEWLAYTLRTYPGQTGRFLSHEPDRFRNPVGHTLRAALSEVAGELFGSFDRTRVTASLGEVVRLRAVQEFSPAEAVEFVTLARHVARGLAKTDHPRLGPGALDVLNARIDDMVVMAADLFEQCRVELRAIAARAARRRVFVLERVQARAAAGAAARRGAPLSAPRGEIP
jgi:hypothetical protein